MASGTAIGRGTPVLGRRTASCHLQSIRGQAGRGSTWWGGCSPGAWQPTKGSDTMRTVSPPAWGGRQSAENMARHQQDQPRGGTGALGASAGDRGGGGGKNHDPRPGHWHSPPWVLMVPRAPGIPSPGLQVAGSWAGCRESWKGEGPPLSLLAVGGAPLVHKQAPWWDGQPHLPGLDTLFPPLLQ